MNPKSNLFILPITYRDTRKERKKHKYNKIRYKIYTSTSPKHAQLRKKSKLT